MFCLRQNNRGCIPRVFCPVAGTSGYRMRPPLRVETVVVLPGRMPRWKHRGSQRHGGRAPNTPGPRTGSLEGAESRHIASNNEGTGVAEEDRQASTTCKRRPRGAVPRRPAEQASRGRQSSPSTAPRVVPRRSRRRGRFPASTPRVGSRCLLEQTGSQQVYAPVVPRCSSSRTGSPMISPKEGLEFEWNRRGSRRSRRGRARGVERASPTDADGESINGGPCTRRAVRRRYSGWRDGATARRASAPVERPLPGADRKTALLRGSRAGRCRCSPGGRRQPPPATRYRLRRRLRNYICGVPRGRSVGGGGAAAEVAVEASNGAFCTRGRSRRPPPPQPPYYYYCTSYR